VTLSAGTVSVGVKPNTSGFAGDLKSQILGGTKGVGEGMGSAILGGLKMFAGPIAAVTAAFSVKHLVEDSVKSFEDLASSVKGIQRVTGGTIEAVSSMRGAMQLAGVDVESAGSAMTIFAKKLGMAGSDAKQTAAMNTVFGQSIKDANGHVKSMADLLPGLADRFASMPNGAEKTALATQLFGRAGAQMIPVLNKGSAGIGELTQKAKEMGLVLDNQAIASLTESKESARNFAGAIQGAKVALGQDLLPVIDAVQNVFRNALAPAIKATTGFLNEHRDSFLKVGEAISNFGKSAGGAVAPFFKTIGDAFKSLAPVFKALIPELLQLSSAFSPVGLIFKSLAPVLPGIIKAIVDLAVSLGSTLASVLKQILPPITQVVNLLVTSMAGIFRQLMPVIVQLAKSLGGALAEEMKMLAPVVVMLVKYFASLITPLMPLIGQIIQLAMMAIMPLVKAIMPLVKELLPPLLDLFKSLMPIVTGLAQFLEAGLVFAIQVLINVMKFLIPIITTVVVWFAHLVAGVVEVGAKITKWFVDLPGVILKALGDAGKWLLGIGKNIVDGLWNGLKAAWNGFMGLFHDLVNLLPDAIKKVLGIKSPSTVFHQIGLNITDGLNNGLKSGFGSIMTTMSDFSAKVVGKGAAMLDKMLEYQAAAISIAGGDGTMSALVYSFQQTGLGPQSSLVAAQNAMAKTTMVGGMDVTALIAQAQAAAQSSTGGYQLYVNPSTGAVSRVAGGDISASDLNSIGLGANQGFVLVDTSSKANTGGAGSNMIPMMANGGIVPATPGGQLIRVGEAGKAEAVIPLDQMGKMTAKNSERPIYADGMGLIGWMKEIAKGESKIVFNNQIGRLTMGGLR
jgi:phage-related protein